MPDFQAYLRSRGLAPEKHIPFHARWAARFLAFRNSHPDLAGDQKVRAFLSHLAVRGGVAVRAAALENGPDRLPPVRCSGKLWVFMLPTPLPQ